IAPDNILATGRGATIAGHRAYARWTPESLAARVPRRSPRQRQSHSTHLFRSQVRMSLRTAIESLPGRAVRGIFGTSNAMDINKPVGAVLVAGLLAMVTGLIADILVPTGEGEHGGEPGTHEQAQTAQEPSGGAAPAAAAIEPVLGLLATADVAAGQA